MRLPTKTVVTSSTMHEHHWLRHLIDCTLPQQAGQRFMVAGLYLTSTGGAAVHGSGTLPYLSRRGSGSWERDCTLRQQTGPHMCMGAVGQLGGARLGHMFLIISAKIS